MTNKYSITFSIDQIRYSDDSVEIAEKALVFPRFLESIIKDALSGEAIKINEIENNNQNVEVKKFGYYVLISKKIKTPKKRSLINSVFARGRGNIYIDSVCIRVPLNAYRYMSLEILLGHSKSIRRQEMFMFMNNLLKERKNIFNFLEVKKNIEQKRVKEVLHFPVKRVLRSFLEVDSLYNQWFSKNEVIIDKEVPLEIKYDDRMKALMLIYQSDGSHEVYESNTFKIKKLILVKNIENSPVKERKFRIRSADIEYKYKSINSYLDVIYSNNGVVKQALGTRDYEINIGKDMGNVFIKFKENSFPPKIEGCALNEDFVRAGIGFVEVGKDSSENRKIVSKSHSNEFNMLLVEAMTSNDISEQEMAHFINDLPEDLTEEEIKELLKINYINDSEYNPTEAIKRKIMNNFYCKVSDIMNSGKKDEEIFSEMLSLRNRYF